MTPLHFAVLVSWLDKIPVHSVTIFAVSLPLHFAVPSPFCCPVVSPNTDMICNDRFFLVIIIEAIL